MVNPTKEGRDLTSAPQNSFAWNSKAITNLQSRPSSTSSPTIPKRLGDKHYRHCCGSDKSQKERGLNPDWIQANCYSVTESEATELLAYKAKSPGIIIQGANGQYQFRPDRPWSDKQGKKAPKYRTAAGDEYDALLPAHPTDKHYWLNLEQLKQHCWHIDGHPCLLVTEGGFKAIAACSEGIPTVALLGVEMGLTSQKLDPQGKRYLVPTLERYTKAGFGFVLGFDSDITIKEEVKEALYKLGFQLQKFGVPVYVLPEWDENRGKGIDDFIQMNEIEAFRQELLSRAIPFKDWSRGYEEENQPKKPPFPDALAKAIAQKYENKWLYSGEHSTWMEYEHKPELIGVWTPVTDLYISVQINKLLQAREITGYGESYLNNIVGLLKRNLYTEEWGENPQLLPFSDCVLNLKTGKTDEHSPKNRLTWVLPRPYNAITLSWDKIDQWLNETTRGNANHKRQLLCFAAAVLRKRFDLHKFLHLIGSGGSGKSTYTNLLTAILGSRNIISMDLEALNERDALADLFGKVLVIFPDQDSAGKKLSNFKKLTGGDYLRGRRLFKDGFNFRFLGMALVTSNNPIFHAGTGRWLTRRTLATPFNNIVPEHKMRDLEKEFEPELSAFTHYLLSIPESEIEAALRGIGQPSMSSTLWSTQVRSDGLASWVNDWVIADSTAKTQIGSNAKQWTSESDYDPTTSTLFGSYCLHSRQTNRTPLTKDNFSANLLELLAHTLGWQVTKSKNRQGLMVINGIRLRTSEDVSIPTWEEVFADGDRHGDLDGHDDGNLKPSQPANDGDDGDPTHFKEGSEKSLNIEPISPKLCSSEPPLDNALVSVKPESQSSTESDASLIASVEASVEASVIDETKIDFSTYPHPTCGDIPPKRKRAKTLKEKMLNCGTQQELKALEFTRPEIEWVWKHLFSRSEKAAISQTASYSQLTLFEPSAATSSTSAATSSSRFQKGDLVQLPSSELGFTRSYNPIDKEWLVLRESDNQEVWYSESDLILVEGLGEQAE
jgi:putative DNA primase/helicase